MTTIDAYLQELPANQQAVAASLTGLLSSHLPDATGQLWHGHPVWLRGKKPIAGFKAFPKYVTLMFWQGQQLQDSSGRLAATGSAQMASLKIASDDQIDDELIVDWISQAAKL